MSTVGSASQPWWKGPIYPATIKQLLRASRPHSQSKFYVDNIELGVVTCVAGIVAISDHGSMTAYSLEDGSAGRLRTTWSRESETSEQFKTHTYVRVVGHLDASTSQDASAAIVREFDELTLVSDSDTAYLSDEYPTELESPQISRRTPRLPSLPSSPMSGDNTEISYCKFRTMMCCTQVVCRSGSCSGVPPSHVLESMNRKSEIDKMMEDGLLYSTIDQYHFKLVD
ncbi:hypothetical protein EDB89DRAFT_51855 [Lactarius sanguifluus]|nr:hypothetical protein EDB89DRAFT_51855 [Lactarius sanguifluus]